METMTETTTAPDIRFSEALLDFGSALITCTRVSLADRKSGDKAGQQKWSKEALKFAACFNEANRLDGLPISEAEKYEALNKFVGEYK